MSRFAERVVAPPAKAGPARQQPRQLPRPPLSHILQLRAAQSARAATTSATPSQGGLPAGLKAGVEQLSGIAMDDVRVHRNSSAPARLGALAYAQGSEIHLGPGQEAHLPHEAWHVVQQKQGRVQPTFQLKEGVPVNDDSGLEAEADAMGARAMQLPSSPDATVGLAPIRTYGPGVVMRRIDRDFPTFRAPNRAKPTKQEMQQYYDRFVENEVARFSNVTIDDDLKDEMTNANTEFTDDQANSNDLWNIFRKLHALTKIVNRAADNWAEQVGAPQAAADEADYRKQRKLRTGAKHQVGTTKPMPLRGIDSAAEGERLLTDLRQALTGSLGGGYNLGQVGVRGSAVTGIRTRNQEAFAQGTGQHDAVSDSSDIDFFFTCPTLATKILDTQDDLLAEGRGINQQGTMMAKYLNTWLTRVAVGDYAHKAALQTALTNFSAAAQGVTGRKCDVTFISGNTAAGLANDAGTLIL